MHIGRRDFIRMTGAAAVATAFGGPALAATQPGRDMYGLIGKIMAVPGQRDALIDILLEGTGDMPGCRSYVVARDPADADAVWVTEVWDSQEHHAASLKLPAVRDAIARGRPMIAGFASHVVTTPVGGYGLGAGRAAAGSSTRP